MNYNSQIDQISPNFRMICKLMPEIQTFNNNECRLLLLLINQLPSTGPVDLKIVNLLVTEYQKIKENEWIEKILNQEISLDDADPSLIEKMMDHPKFMFLLKTKLLAMHQTVTESLENPEDFNHSVITPDITNSKSITVPDSELGTTIFSDFDLSLKSKNSTDADVDSDVNHINDNEANPEKK